MDNRIDVHRRRRAAVPEFGSFFLGLALQRAIPAHDPPETSSFRRLHIGLIDPPGRCSRQGSPPTRGGGGMVPASRLFFDMLDSAVWILPPVGPLSLFVPALFKFQSSSNFGRIMA